MIIFLLVFLSFNCNFNCNYCVFGLIEGEIVIEENFKYVYSKRVIPTGL